MSAAFDALMDRALDVVFARFGRAATWYRDGVEISTVIIRDYRGDGDREIIGIGLTGAMGYVEVRESELAQAGLSPPRKGDVLDIWPTPDGRDGRHVIQAKPERDRRRWQLDIVPERTD